MRRTVTTPLHIYESTGIKTDESAKAGSSSVCYLWIGLQGRSTGMVTIQKGKSNELISLIKFNACQPWLIAEQRFKRLPEQQALLIEDFLKTEGIDIYTFLS